MIVQNTEYNMSEYWFKKQIKSKNGLKSFRKFIIQKIKARPLRKLTKFSV